MNTAGTDIEYQWRYDSAYYRTVIDRYYRQLPFLLHLPTQFTLLWIFVMGVSWSSLGLSVKELILWALPIGGLAIPSLVWLTKKAIFLKYRSSDSARSVGRRGCSGRRRVEKVNVRAIG